jgi:hypothetical protein
MTDSVSTAREPDQHGDFGGQAPDQIDRAEHANLADQATERAGVLSATNDESETSGSADQFPPWSSDPADTTPLAQRFRALNEESGE